MATFSHPTRLSKLVKAVIMSDQQAPGWRAQKLCAPKQNFKNIVFCQSLELWNHQG